MVDAVTNNRSLTQPTVGGDAGTWGGVLNTGTIGQLDLVLGNTQQVALTSADITLSQAQWNNLAIQLTGTLTGNHNVYLPFSPNSTTSAVGGSFIIENSTTGSFNATISTTASGATGVVAYQGVNTLLWSDGTSVRYADDSAARFTPVNGNPNGALAGTAAAVNNPPHPLAWDYSGGTGAWVPTTTGTSTSTVWAQLAAIGAALPVPEAYLTPVSGTPIITSDSTGATVVYYTPFTGQWALVHNGTQIIPYQMAAQFSLTLTSSQAANGIYDFYLAYNGGTPVLGTGPNWTSGTGGSVTAGSCARGTGVGGAALARLQGVWTNAVSMSLIYNTGSGNNTISVPANQGIYLGSLFIDAAAGQVTCHRSYGQSRKWGIFNAYNRAPTVLLAGDPTATWTVANPTSTRPSNSNTANSLTTFAGLPEEIATLEFLQTGLSSSGSNNVVNVGVGYNSTSAFSGKTGHITVVVGAVDGGNCRYVAAPTLGINVVTSLEGSSAGVSTTLGGTQANMLLTGAFRA